MSVLFVAIAGLTLFLAWRIFTTRAESALRSHAEEVAIGHTAAVAAALPSVAQPNEAGLRVANRGSASSIFVFDKNGNLVASDARGMRLRDVPGWQDAELAAAQGRRFIGHSQGNLGAVVGLPMAPGIAGAIVSYTPTGAVGEEMAVLRRELAMAAVTAFLVAVLLGVIVASVIAQRMRALQHAALRIERGDFETPVRAWFPDEVGDLERAVDGMRRRLRQNFLEIEGKRRRMATLVSRLRQAVILIDRDMRVQFVNQRGGELDGRVQVGQSLAATCPPLAEVAATFFEAPDAGLVDVTVAVAGRSYAAAGVAPETEDEGLILVLRDLTEETRREQAAKDFIANASHELRTPIAAIANAVEVLESGGLDDPNTAQRFVGHLRTQSTRLRRLCASLLTLARAEAIDEVPQLEVVLLEPVVRTVADDLGLPLDVQIDCPADAAVAGHPELVAEVVENLVANALKHSAGLPVALLVECKGAEVEISVVDNGPGIALEHRERVFERFVQLGDRQDSGFGIGLSIVRAAVGLMAGHVQVDSTPGGGTRFTVTLPAAAVPMEVSA